MTVLEGMKEEVMNKLEYELNGVVFVFMTTDFWTSHAVESYLGVTCYLPDVRINFD